MRTRYAVFFALLKDAALKWNADNCLRLGASLSYFNPLYALWLKPRCSTKHSGATAHGRSIF
jgi:hypothetical protein